MLTFVKDMLALVALIGFRLRPVSGAADAHRSVSETWLPGAGIIKIQH